MTRQAPKPIMTTPPEEALRLLDEVWSYADPAPQPDADDAAYELAEAA